MFIARTVPKFLGHCQPTKLSNRTSSSRSLALGLNVDSIASVWHKGTIMKPITLITLTLGLAFPAANNAANWSAGMKEGKLALKSTAPVGFGQEGILFIADTKAAAVAALATGDTKPAAGAKL